MFGPNAIYKSGGDDTLFIVDCLKKGLKLYSSPIVLGNICSDTSTWFKGYNKKYFFDKGALFTAISNNFRYFLIIQYLLRHKEVLKDIGFKEAYKIMLERQPKHLVNLLIFEKWEMLLNVLTHILQDIF